MGFFFSGAPYPEGNHMGEAACLLARPQAAGQGTHWHRLGFREPRLLHSPLQPKNIGMCNESSKREEMHGSVRK